MEAVQSLRGRLPSYDLCHVVECCCMALGLGWSVSCWSSLARDTGPPHWGWTLCLVCFWGRAVDAQQQCMVHSPHIPPDPQREQVEWYGLRGEWRGADTTYKTVFVDVVLEVVVTGDGISWRNAKVENCTGNTRQSKIGR